MQDDRINQYLRQLTPLARSNLLTELERLELCGAAMPQTADILATLRAEFRKGGQTHSRVANPSRHFFMPLEPLLVNGAPRHDNSGRILRGSLAPIWEWISRDLLPTMANDYVAAMKDLIVADNQQEAGRVAAAFQTKVLKYLESMLASPEGADQVRANLGIYTASHAVFADLSKMLSVLRARDALSKFNASLPKAIEKFDDQQVAKMTRLLDAFGKTHPDEIPFALALIAKRLKFTWQLIRLATKASPTKDAADVARTPYAMVVSMVLDRLDDKQLELQIALRNSRVIVAKEILAEVYNTEHALRVRISQLEKSDWGTRLRNILDAIATVVDQEIKRFPPNVGHVLGSRRLRIHDSWAGRLTSLAWRGRDALTGGAAYCAKLIS